MCDKLSLAGPVATWSEVLIFSRFLRALGPFPGDAEL
jgi:hypothetical protein